MNKLVIGGAIAAALISGPLSASAATFVLANSSFGDGYATAVAGGYDLFGADNGAAGNTTTETATASSAGTVTYSYTYTSHDVDGASFDPGGYFLDGVFTQLSPSSSGQNCSANNSREWVRVG